MAPAETRLLLLLVSLPRLLRAASPSDPPPAPALTVTPWRGEYLPGDVVAARCSVPAAALVPPLKVQAFQFWGTGGWALEARTANVTYVHLFAVTGPRDAGTLGCTYTAAGGRTRRPLRSRESRLVFINVRAPPPQPTLTVSAEADALELSCAAPPGAAGRRFRFYRDGDELGGAQDGGRDGDGQDGGRGDGQDGGRLRLGGAARAGNFSCAYEEEAADGRRVLSPRSAGLPLRPPGASPALSAPIGRRRRGGRGRRPAAPPPIGRPAAAQEERRRPLGGARRQRGIQHGRRHHHHGGRRLSRIAKWPPGGAPQNGRRGPSRGLRALPSGRRGAQSGSERPKMAAEPQKMASSSIKRLLAPRNGFLPPSKWPPRGAQNGGRDPPPKTPQKGG